MVSDFRPQESYQFFFQEAPDLLREIEAGILGLRHEQSISKLWELMRTAHSIKGGAACAGLTHIQEIAHYLEAAFKAIAESGIDLSDSTEALLLQAFDCLKMPIFTEIQTGWYEPKESVMKAHAVWMQLEESLHAQRPIKIQAQKDDVTHLLFAEDVARGLHQLEQILAQENHAAAVLDFLPIQAQIFRGIGEISRLNGFIAIADAAIRALNLNSHEASVIGQLALVDFRQAQAAVLDGDRLQGGSPSQALLDLTQISLSPEPTLDLPLIEADRFSPIEDRSDPLLIASETSLLPLSPSDPPSPTPILMSVRQDWARLEGINTLVGELISLDNRLLTQNQEHEETLEVFLRSFSRIKQQTVTLYRWSNQFLPHTQVTNPSQNQAIPGKSSPAQNIGFIQNTLEGVLEELSQLSEVFNDLSLLGQQYQQILKQKQKTLKTVKTSLLQTQMLPVGELLHQFPRVLHDLALHSEKQIKLDLQGDSTLIEKAVLEKLYDPLVHLVRNAFDHGIEPTAVRQALNKPLQGTIRLKAWHQGHHTYLSVEDDGRGIDLETIQAKLLAMGWISATDAAESLPTTQLYQYLFEPSFTTAPVVSHLSGRGMGLYAVQSQVSTLKGTITVKSQVGKGTSFVLRLPLASNITKLLVFRISRHFFAVPVSALAAIILTEEVFLQTQQQQAYYHWKGQFVPILSMAAIATYSYPTPSLSPEGLRQTDLHPLGEESGSTESQKFPLLFIAHGTQIIALKIDEVIMEQDLVIKPFNRLAIQPPNALGGCTILGDGRLVPVLDSLSLIEKWGQIVHSQPQVPDHKISSSSALLSPRTILLIDDSLTMRQAISSTLQKAGYHVLQAKDGREALNLVQQDMNIAGMICDIEMPRMNGLEFLSRCRQQEISIPIVMLTYRSAQRYRQLAQELGASAYLTKPYLDKELLQTLEQCLAPKVQSLDETP